MFKGTINQDHVIKSIKYNTTTKFYPTKWLAMTVMRIKYLKELCN